MTASKKALYSLIFGMAGLAVALFFSQPNLRPEPKPITGEVSETAKDPPLSEDREEPPPQVLPKFVRHDVPFTVQAPLANWHDARYQNACEEASVLMAGKWLLGQKLSAEQANSEIADMVVFEQENYGFYIDSSAEDTARFFRDYYSYEKIYTQDAASTDDIKRELAKGNLVLTPMDGRKLGNPYYTPPGPERHMLVLIGYDDDRGVFITNDPGTRRGEGLVYDYDVLFSAIRDYASGDHEPIEKLVKRMIVVEGR